MKSKVKPVLPSQNLDCVSIEDDFEERDVPYPAQQHDKQLLTDAVVQTNLTRAMTSQVTVEQTRK